MPLAHRINALRFDETRLARLVDDLTDEHWFAPDPAGHTCVWLVGHLAGSRHRMLTLSGLEAPTTLWEAHIMRGTKPSDLPRSVRPASLLVAFREAGERLIAHLPSLPPGELSRPIGRTLPDGATTVGPALDFYLWHEAYHLGQLGLLRTLLGKPGLG